MRVDMVEGCGQDDESGVWHIERLTRKWRSLLGSGSVAVKIGSNSSGPADCV